MMIFLFAFWHSSSKKYSEIKLFSTGLSPHLSFVSPVCFFPLTMIYGEQLLVDSMLLLSLSWGFPPVWWAEMCPELLVPVSVPWSVPRWCDCVGAPHCWKQGITQCCSTLPVDAPSCVGWLGLHGEQWDASQSLHLICPCVVAWSETWAIALFPGHAGVQITFAKKVLFLSLARDFYGTSAQFSLPEHGLLLWFKFASLKQCCMDGESPRS